MSVFDYKIAFAERVAMLHDSMDGFLRTGEQRTLLAAMRHYPIAGGKRLRPVMAMTAAEALGGEEAARRAVPFGISLEMIHNFTLVHDDIMDDDDVRRGRRAVHVEFDLPTAINAGDALFARAFEVLLETEADDAAVRRLVGMVATMVREIGEGQQDDMEMERGEGVTLERYMTMIEKKTARMFQTAAAGGVLIAKGDDDQVRAMDEYGRRVGLGFQIWDDLLDLIADQETLGKPVGSDLLEGKRTALALHFLENSTREQRAQFHRAFERREADREDVAAAVGAMREAGTLDYGTALALEHADRARKMLRVLPDGPARDALSGLVDFMVKRKS